jgi:peroxiredoxin
VVWGIGSEDGYDALSSFVEQMGLTYPVLFDGSGDLLSIYDPGKPPTNSVYPQDYIIGVDGTVVYVNTKYEPDEMIAVIETELQKMSDVPNLP